ncbi:MAG: nitroreductase family deazaflavin-dependent oxidoreductase [Deltaproteobacteria bacterium]
MQRIREVEPPSGLKRFFFRLPLRLYQFGLGHLLGGRFVLLRHTGRKSGLARQAVLEVIRHDEASHSVLVASGFGDASDWLRNIRKTPDVAIEYRGDETPRVARILGRKEAQGEIVGYGRRNPRAAAAVARVCGWQIDGSEEDLRAFAGEIRVIAFDLPAVEPFCGTLVI